MLEPRSPFFLSFRQPPMFEPPSPTDEPPSPLLKSRIPRKTILVDDRNLFTQYTEYPISNLHCPLRKGIIYYHWYGVIFEHNIHSSGKHEPRIIVPKHPSRRLKEILFVPIKGNRMLLFAKYSDKKSIDEITLGSYLHLSIHEIRSNHRVGPALWSYNGSVDGRFNISHLELIKSAENSMGITFWARFDDHWKLFDIYTTDTDGSDKFPLIESGRIDFDLKLDSLVMLLSPDRRILLNSDFWGQQHSEIIDIHYLDSGGTNNMNFSFVTRMSIPIPRVPEDADIELLQNPELAFSADRSKFAIAVNHGRVSVWDIRSKTPLTTFMEVPKSDVNDPHVVHLQFSSGNSGKEVLVFIEHNNSFLEIIHVIDATSFETEEILILELEQLEQPGMYLGVGALFFDPGGGTLYAELAGILYEWDLRKNENGPEWWIGEE